MLLRAQGTGEIFVTVGKPIIDPNNFNVTHDTGLACRPATLKVNGRASYASGIFPINIQQGDHLIVRADGQDVIQVIARVVDHFNTAGKTCFTGVIRKQRHQHGDFIASCMVDGHERFFKISPLTRLFQAQAIPELAEKIYKGLKSGDSVVMWVDNNPASCVPHVNLLTVNYR